MYFWLEIQSHTTVKVSERKAVYVTDGGYELCAKEKNIFTGQNQPTLEKSQCLQWLFLSGGIMDGFQFPYAFCYFQNFDVNIITFTLEHHYLEKKA